MKMEGQILLSGRNLRGELLIQDVEVENRGTHFRQLLIGDQEREK